MSDDYPQLHSLEAAGPETLVLTANQRLGRYYEVAYADSMQARGLRAWQRPRVYSLTAWFHQQWQFIQRRRLHALADCARLSAQQESALWQQIFSDNNQGFELLNESDTAELVRKAWQNVRLWRLNLDDLPEYTETLFLKNLVRVFEEYCRREKRIDETALMEAVVASHLDNRMDAPAETWLYGFQEHAPLVQCLLDHWQAQGSIIRELNPGFRETRSHVYFCLNEDDEIKRAARWSSAILHSLDESKRERARIGIVIPDLARMRSRVERIFNEVFEPQYTFARNARHSPGFNISAAVSLLETPPIAAALYALELNRFEVERETLAHVLMSPFIADDREIPARATLMQEMFASVRHLRRSQLFTRCAELCAAGEGEENSTRPALDNFYRCLKAFQEKLRTVENRRLSPRDWAKVFAEQLQALAWPGRRPGNTLEYQQLQKWSEVLENFAALDGVLQGPLSVSEALYYLRACARVPFHAQTLSSPVQVLGLLEAAGLQFDYLWVMQMDDQHWPMPSEPNPFIPLALQIQHGMPRASAEGELRYAGKLTGQLKHSAQHSIFSCAQQVEDREQNISPLLRDLECLQEVPGESVDSYNEVIASQADRPESVNDSRAPALVNVEAIRGGTQVLQDQAACYFKAFAKHRLGVEPLEEAEAGIGPRERGILVHQSLDIIWRRLRTQESLLAASQEALEKLIADAISQAWHSVLRQSEIGTKLLQIETRRTQSLLLQWLQLEKQRPPFKVLQQEKSRAITIAGLPLKVRFDRLDQLEDGSVFVIDYKTGSPDISAWSGERPDEPQVPLYAIANKDNLGAAAFGLINAKELEFKGISQHARAVPGLKSPAELKRMQLPTDWDEILQQWHATLENLARSFLAGEADVNPKRKAQTCRHCGLQSLCRVQEYIADDFAQSGEVDRDN